MATQFRVGIGTDIHRLVSDRPLMLGGVRIEHHRGLLSHSDGDVVLHALADAILGAAGMGDIGELFPDSDPLYKDADSSDLLREVHQRTRRAGYRPGNVDIIIQAQRPNLSGYKKAIAQSVADLLEMDPADVNVKAKTNEGLGPVGAEEAMECTAVVLLLSD